MTCRQHRVASKQCYTSPSVLTIERISASTAVERTKHLYTRERFLDLSVVTRKSGVACNTVIDTGDKFSETIFLVRT